MTQEAVQITTTPPLPGLQLVQDMNKALETIATDFAGSTDPAAMAWAYSTWADTGTGTFKRRNSANSAWAIEGRLLRAHLPMYAQVDVPALDIGPIYIIGKGPAEWVGAAYKPLISGIPGATFAEVDALVADQGPIIVTDMGGAVYVWSGSDYVPLLASETYAGAIKLATAALAQGLTDDTTALTPKKLADAFKGSNQSLSWPGYQALPGGLIVQFFRQQFSHSGAGTLSAAVTFPIAFPTACFAVASAAETNTPATYLCSTNAPSVSGFTAYSTSNAAGNPWYHFIAIGA